MKKLDLDRLLGKSVMKRSMPITDDWIDGFQCAVEAAQLLQQEDKSTAGQIPISSLKFSIRTSNCLNFAGIKTVNDLIRYGEDNLLELRNFGAMALGEVKDVLGREGFVLAPGFGPDGWVGDREKSP